MSDNLKFRPVRYQLRQTEFNSSRFGPCEVCHRPCSEVWTQTAYEPVEHQGDRWECHRGIRFGHKDCLLSERGSENEKKRIAHARAHSAASIQKKRDHL